MTQKGDEGQRPVPHNVDIPYGSATPIQIGQGTGEKASRLVAAARDRRFTPVRHVATISRRNGAILLHKGGDKPRLIALGEVVDLDDCFIQCQSVDS